jgi:uncharacterized protein
MRETVTISLPQAVRRELDKVAKEEGVSRSDVLRQSLEDFLFVRRFRQLRQRMMAAAQAQASTPTRTCSRASREAAAGYERAVAALMARGTCGDLLEHCVRPHVVISSQPLLDELADVLSRKLRQRSVDARAAVRLFEETFTLVVHGPLEPPIYRDPDDDVVLATARAGECDAIVTGSGSVGPGSISGHPSTSAVSLLEMGIGVAMNRARRTGGRSSAGKRHHAAPVSKVSKILLP